MELLRSVSRLIVELEQGLGKVVRWNQFHTQSGARRQSSLDHTASIMAVGIFVLEAERRHNPTPINGELLLKALFTHDIGELLYADDGHDTLYVDKCDAKDLAEHAKFREFIAKFPSWLSEHLMRPYLLQYLHKDLAFDTDAKMAIIALQPYAIEHQLFVAAENYDYFTFAFHEYERRGNLRILIHTLRLNHPKLKDLAGKLPGFAAEIYTPSLIAWVEEMLKAHEDIDLEAIPDSFDEGCETVVRQRDSKAPLGPNTIL